MLGDVFVHDTYVSFNLTPAQGVVIGLVLFGIVTAAIFAFVRLMSRNVPSR